MALIPLALQLYSVKDDAKDDLASVIKQAGAWGYAGVEFAGYHGHSAADIRKMLDDAGLECCGAHVPVDALSPEKFAETVAFHQTIGCPFLIVPSIPEDQRNSVATCTQTAELFAKIASDLESHGLRTGFHAHSGDCAPLKDDPTTTAWRQFAQRTGDEFVMQYDTANGMEGCGDAVQPILDHPGRGASVHLKAFVQGEADGHGKALVGEGSVPWDAVFEACEKPVDQGGAGTAWYVVEQEGHPTLNPMDAARACLKKLRAMGK